MVAVGAVLVDRSEAGAWRQGAGTGLDHLAVEVVGVIVVVVVDRQAASVLAEQLDEGRVAADLLGVP